MESHGKVISDLINLIKVEARLNNQKIKTIWLDSNRLRIYNMESFGKEQIVLTKDNESIARLGINIEELVTIRQSKLSNCFRIQYENDDILSFE